MFRRKTYEDKRMEDYLKECDEKEQKYKAIKKDFERNPNLFVTGIDEIIKGCVIGIIRDWESDGGFELSLISTLNELFTIREQLIKTECYKSSTNNQE